MIIALSYLACALAVVPTGLFLRNLARYRALPPIDGARRACSVLIPARNEEGNLAGALDSLLASQGVDCEIIILDDGSTDRTAEIARAFAERDGRVRLETAAPLPPGWGGKNHACWQLAALARHPLLIFLDADVRVARPDALARLARFLATGPAALVSGVPHEETGTWLELLIIPLIHFILLGFLPLERMRQSTDPRYAAACGQILAVRRDAYERAGGHAAVAGRLHEAVALARIFRSRGCATDLFDATDTFRCRMYRGAREVWQGFAKNAHEGLAAPRLIVPATLLLLGGQVLPLILVCVAPSTVACIALAAALLPRVVAAWRFRQSLAGAILHPLGICVLVAIQWFAFFRSLRGRPAAWKGRLYSARHAT